MEEWLMLSFVYMENTLVKTCKNNYRAQRNVKREISFVRIIISHNNNDSLYHIFVVTFRNSNTIFRGILEYR